MALVCLAVLVLLTRLLLTVLFDMGLAVGVGLLLAAGRFIKRMSDLSDSEALAAPSRAAPRSGPWPR